VIKDKKYQNAVHEFKEMLYAVALSWQVVPTTLIQLLNDPDTEKSRRVIKAMLQMKKIDIETLKKAADNRL